MGVIFQDLHSPDNPLNGASLETADAIADLFQAMRGREPFFFDLRDECEATLTIGFAGDAGCVQHAIAGEPPYLMAVNDGAVADGKFVEFLSGSTLTPVPSLFILPIDRVRVIAIDFPGNGDKSKNMAWVELESIHYQPRQAETS